MSTGTLAANGDTATVVVNGPVHLHLSGTFGGGTVTMNFMDAGGNWRAISEGGFTAACDKEIAFPTGTGRSIKGTLAGATTPSLVWSFN